MNKQMEKLQKIEKWRKNNPGYWSIICNTYGDKSVSLSAYQNMLKNIMKESLYELLFIFFETHKDHAIIHDAVHELFLEMLFEQIENHNIKDVIDQLIYLLN